MLTAAAEEGVCLGSRDPRQLVEYQLRGFHEDARKTYSRILRIEPRKQGSLVTIEAPKIKDRKDFAVTQTPPTEFVSSDGGDTWKSSREYMHWTMWPTHDEFGYPYWLRAQAPSSPSVLYRGLETGALLRSETGGDSWILARMQVAGKPTESLAMRVAGSRHFHAHFYLAAIHPQHPLTLYATISVVPWAGSKPFTKAINLSGLYISQDGGETWVKFTDAVANQKHYDPYPSPLGISASDPRVMYAPGPNGLIRTKDGGRTWSPAGSSSFWNDPPRYRTQPDSAPHTSPRSYRITVFQVAVGPTDPNVVLVVTDKGLFRSVDGGESWSLLDLGLDEIEAINSVAIDPNAPSELYVGSMYGVFKSTDLGCNFERVFPEAD